jgi:exosome complex component RRP43
MVTLVHKQSPNSDLSSSLSLVPNVVLSPLSHPKHKPGPPSDQAQSLSAQIYSLILAICPNLPSALCIERGKCAWTLYIDVQFLNYDGNAFDPAWLAVSSTLSRIQLPPITFNTDLNRGVIVDGGAPAKLPFAGENTFACSFVGIDEGKYVLFDPDEEEESLATEMMTVVTDEERRLRYLFKSGIGLKRDDIKRCIELAGERAGYLSFVLEKSASKIQTSE